MAGPLTNFGNVLLEAARDNANIRLQDQREATQRQQALADEERRRQYAIQDYQMRRADQQMDTAEQRAYETNAYKQRKWDSITMSLVKDGYLDIKDVENPEAITAAINKGGVEYQRKLDELAGYKALAPKLIEAVGNVDGADRLLTMTPDQIEEARAIVGSGYKKLGALVDQARESGIVNKQMGAALLGVELSNQTKISNEIADIEAGRVTPKEEAKAIASARAKLMQDEPRLFEKQESRMSPAARAERDQKIRALSDAAIVKSQEERLYWLKASLKDSSIRAERIYDGVKSGIFGYLKTINPADAPAPAPDLVPNPSFPGGVQVVPKAPPSLGDFALPLGPTNPNLTPPPQSAAPMQTPPPAAPSPDDMDAILRDIQQTTPQSTTERPAALGDMQNALRMGAVEPTPAALPSGVVVAPPPSLGLTNNDLLAAIQQTQQQANSLPTDSPLVGQLNTRIRSLQSRITPPSLGVA